MAATRNTMRSHTSAIHHAAFLLLGLFVVMGWMSRPRLGDLLGIEGLSDAGIVMMAAFLLPGVRAILKHGILKQAAYCPPFSATVTESIK